MCVLTQFAFSLEAMSFILKHYFILILSPGKTYLAFTPTITKANGMERKTFVVLFIFSKCASVLIVLSVNSRIPKYFHCVKGHRFSFRALPCLLFLFMSLEHRVQLSKTDQRKVFSMI